jgi:hypothetical protein
MHEYRCDEFLFPMYLKKYFMLSEGEKKEILFMLSKGEKKEKEEKIGRKGREKGREGEKKGRKGKGKCYRKQERENMRCQSDFVATGDFTTVTVRVRGSRRLHRTSARGLDSRRPRKMAII